MIKPRLATAALALLLFAGVAAPSHAEESRGGFPEAQKSPRKKERETRAPNEQGTPVTKPDSGKIVYF